MKNHNRIPKELQWFNKVLHIETKELDDLDLKKIFENSDCRI
jgi:hypothetical protein